MKLELRIDEPGYVDGTMAFDGDEAPLPLKRVPEAALVSKLRKQSNPKIGLLPPAVRWVSSDKKIVAFERPPQFNMMEYYPVARDKVSAIYNAVSFNLPLPWLVYLVYFSDDYIPVNVRVYSRNEPIEDLNSKLGLLPLLNFYANGELCNPIFEKLEDFQPSLANGINAAYNMVWNSGFNYDLQDATALGRHYEVPRGVAVEYRKMRRDRKSQYYYVDVIGAYYAAWAELSIGDVLGTNWPTPYGSRKGVELGNGGKYLTLDHAIKTLRQEVEGEYPRDAQAFMVNLVNTMGSI